MLPVHEAAKALANNAKAITERIETFELLKMSQNWSFQND